ncbi:tol-pal system YbgF family protein [Pendulispora albinea]|uniref:PEGA domain-containing protein n=1 Tax=Pendulispora albinea TaxID=2741071 RepID=A0ABZ2LL80_9BACT
MLGRCILSMALAASLFATPAYADDSRAMAESQKSLATGIKQYKNGDREGAAISFAQSFAAWPSGEALRRLAIAEFELDRPVEALKHFRMYALDRNADVDFVKTKLPAYLEQSRARVGHLRVLAAPEAIVTVDNRRVQERGEDGVVDVVPGEHVVAIRGQDPSTARSVRVEATRTVEVDLRPSPATGSRGAESMSTARTSAGGGPSPANAVGSEKMAWPPPVMTIAFAGVSAVALGVGIGFGLAANGKDSEREEFSASHPGACPAGPSCTELRDMTSSQNRSATISDVALGTAAVAAVGAAASWFFFPRERVSPSTAMVPAVHRGGAGISLTRTF